MFPPSSYANIILSQANIFVNNIFLVFGKNFSTSLAVSVQLMYHTPVGPENMPKKVLKQAIASAGKTKKESTPAITIEEAISRGLNLVRESKICLLGTNGADGFPNIKAMLNLKHEGLKHIWFSTNTSSKRVQQIKKDKRACVYYVDENNFRGLMLVGTIDILQDEKSRKMLWAEGAEVYYPLGINDPDYSVLRFTALWGNYYHGLSNITFSIDNRP
jgi:general stress protein 26